MFTSEEYVYIMDMFTLGEYVYIRGICLHHGCVHIIGVQCVTLHMCLHQVKVICLQYSRLLWLHQGCVYIGGMCLYHRCVHRVDMFTSGLVWSHQRSVFTSEECVHIRGVCSKQGCMVLSYHGCGYTFTSGSKIPGGHHGVHQTYL